MMSVSAVGIPSGSLIGDHSPEVVCVYVVDVKGLPGTACFVCLSRICAIFQPHSVGP